MMLSESFWREEMNGETTGWATFTIGVILLVIIRHLVIATTSRFRSTFSPLSLNRSDVASPKQSINPIVSQSPISHNRISSMVSDLELKTFIDNLDEKLQDKEKWDNVVERSNNLISYYAKCCKPKNGPLKYLSVTIFEDCDSELLRDFYMDNDYRKQWDKTVVAHEQLEVDKSSGTEVGRTIKKFPLLTSREYVLAWRLWDGNDGTYYCFTKECEHPLAPRQKKYVRVRFLRSGWRIRKVPGRNACEIKMVHQEDAGLNVEMAKLAFAKGIWSFVCKMDDALRKYNAIRVQLNSALNATTFIQKVPPVLEDSSISRSSHSETTNGICSEELEEIKHASKRRRPSSNKQIANGLIVLGGVIFLSRGHSNLGAKVAMAYILGKLTKNRTAGVSSSCRKPRRAALGADA